MQNNSFTLNNIYNLMRLGAPTGYILSFFPAAFAVLLAYQSATDLLYIPLFFICSILTRAAGCIINDLYDQDFDKYVERTKNRPITSKKISVRDAVIILLLILLLCFAILLSLTVTAIKLGVAAFVMISIYPLMKRYTYFPQVFLGLTFNAGALIGYAAITNDLSIEAIILYISCGFWIFGYDTIYGFMDIKDDKKVGIKSTAIFFEHKNYKLVITISYMIFIILFGCAVHNMSVYISYLALLIATIILLYSVYSLDVDQVENCLLRFKVNNYVGLVLFIGLLLEKL